MKIHSLPTAPVAVTVFPSRARLTRRGRISLEAGRHRLEVAGLPPALETASLRVQARGPQGMRLLGSEVLTTHHAESPAEQVRALEARIQELGRQIHALLDRQETLEKQRAHLDGLGEATRTFAYALATGKTTPAAHAELLDFLSRRRDTLLEARRDLETRLEALRREEEKARADLEALRSARPRRRTSVFIELETPQGGEAEITLTYLLPDARWQPLYDLRWQDGKLEVAYLAQVTQSTGEDWPEVALTLSTAYPSLASIPPKLPPWYVAPAPPPAPVRAGTVAPAPAMAVMDSALPPAAARPAAKVAAEGPAVTYRLETPLSIPSDGRAHKAHIGTWALEADLRYICAPKRVDAAYRRVRARNRSAYLLLPGPAQLFEGETYLGTSKIPLTAPGEEMELYLGVDDRLRVRRKLTRRETDKRFLGGQRRIRYAYEIKLRNHTGAPQTVEVRDHIPQARHEAIKVTLDSARPEPAERDGLNRLRWEISLRPEEERVVTFAFSVEHPAEMEVRGLP